MCVKKTGSGSKGNIWWCNEEVKETVSIKKDAHKAKCQNSTDVNKRRYRNMKNKVVSKTMREKAEEALTDLKIAQV